MSDFKDPQPKNVVTLTAENKNNCEILHEVNELREVLKKENSTYMKYKIIYDTIQELVEKNSILDEGLIKKTKDILMNSQCSQLVIVDKNCRDKTCATVFGIGETSVDLNYPERNSLKNTLEHRLNEKFIQLDFDFEINTHSTKSSTLQLNAEDQLLIDLKKKLKDEQTLYIDNQFKKQEILEEIKDLRLKEVPKIVNEKYIESASLCQMNEVKTQILHKKVRVDIFTESSISLEAYKQFISDLKSQQKDCQKDIDDLNDLKEKYKNIACKQYNDILKSYLQLRASNDKKKLLYDCMKS